MLLIVRDLAELSQIKVPNNIEVINLSKHKVMGLMFLEYGLCETPCLITRSFALFGEEAIEYLRCLNGDLRYRKRIY